VRELTALRGRWARSSMSVVEISVDLYPISGRDEERQLLVGVLQRHFLPRADLIQVDRVCRESRSRSRQNWALLKRLRPRQAWRSGFAERLRPDLGNELCVDATSYFGEQKTRGWRVMDKVSNQRTGSVAVNLPQEQKRARVEVTLASDQLHQLGIDTLRDLRSFSVQAISRQCFSFWTPTISSLPTKASPFQTLIGNARQRLDLQLFKSIGVTGALFMDYARAYIPAAPGSGRNGPSRRIGTTGSLMAWTELNDAVRRALMRLSL
jgi:hypothetical protein